MSTTTHSFSPEEIMAYLDSELSATEAAQVGAHLEECAECRALASELRTTSQTVAGWTIEPVPASIAEALEQRHSLPKPTGHRTSWNSAPRPFWASLKFGAAVAICVLLLVGILIQQSQPGDRRLLYQMEPSSGRDRTVTEREDLLADTAKPTQQDAFIAGAGGLRAPAAAPPPIPMKTRAVAAVDTLDATSIGPMIARSIALTLQVKDCVAARSALDAVLARHHGYAAKVTLSTPAGTQATFSASLRIPIPELVAALAEIRSTGRVLQETQSGEEVTQQHIDLVARLRNARETEDRLRQLLAMRTGKIDDLLQVEQQMDETRGQIESMEAELQQLDHRVDFASVDLDCSEPYREQLSSPQSASAGTQIANAMVAGLRHAGATLLGMMLFVEEFGPSILIWMVPLGVPTFFLVRRYRKLRSSL